MSVGALHFCQSTFKHAECTKNSSLHLWTSSKSNAFLSGSCLKACCSLPERANGKFVLQMRRYPFRKFLKWNGVKRIQPVYMYGMSYDTRTWQAYASVWLISIVVTGTSPVYWKTKPSFVCEGFFPKIVTHNNSRFSATVVSLFVLLSEDRNLILFREIWRVRMMQLKRKYPFRELLFTF